MAEPSARENKLIQYLNEAYGKEKQLESVLQLQIKLAKSLDRKTIHKRLQDHLKETKAQARGLERRIKQLGGKADASALPGPAGDAASAVSSAANKALAAAKGPVQALRGTSPQDNLLRNLRDSFWNEWEEIGHYNVIESVAEQLGDKDTVTLAREFRRQEERMQAFIAKQLPSVIKDVIKAEVPKEERAAATSSSSRRRSTSSRSSSSRSKSRTASSRSSGSSSRSSGSSSRSRASSSGSSSRSSGSSSRSKASSSRSSGSSSRSGGSSSRSRSTSRSSS